MPPVEGGFNGVEMSCFPMRSADMAFRISANLGDRKPFFPMSEARAGAAHVEAVIDDDKIDREHASRLLRAMADRLLECDWPPDQARRARTRADAAHGN
jgi:hypothetical protein